MASKASSSPANPSPRAARTRAALIAAGFELLVERPIDAIPIDDVVAKAGVAKGSFFNHFADKQDFANAIATEVRLEVEALITKANDGVANPVERIAGGMRVAAEFAMAQPKRSAVLLRSQGSSTARAHPLNRGVVGDFEAACQQGLLRPEAQQSGVLYWLGLCQAIMTNIVERRPSRDDANRRLAEMLVLGLTGLGIDAAEATRLARLKA
ncbi:TetR/AcrR family transcriptional regulator [Sphingorhabdus buctiana]|jgi:AcrR family transcriptional regulator|uniref:TetR/AcrR family transcriptional regulator n=1 Tax=Sphingorhabdus buctiana TaxID=1508805 RepID=A0ABW4MIS1_9SPHN